MATTARDVMKTEVRTVSPDISLTDLDELFIENRVTGFPVIESDRLIGVVSRSDIVRKIVAEQSYAEYVSDYYRDVGSFDEPRAAETLPELGSQIGSRLASATVRDVMSQDPVTVSADDPISGVARRLIERRIHRVPVVASDGRLVGIITSLDLVALLVERESD
ncbi:MAG: CBS domain-containing protein [Deltaproteobacteria bacterium]|nr:CBS domain-containing protein [Deltaproteobacteria bacterium]MBW2400559.1 CBS domain-containing protein [Deltaproteobacteria bacterium]